MAANLQGIDLEGKYQTAEQAPAYFNGPAFIPTEPSQREVSTTRSLSNSESSLDSKGLSPGLAVVAAASNGRGSGGGGVLLEGSDEEAVGVDLGALRGRAGAMACQH
eukprot:2407949-Rhodomonas_salina.1